MVGVLKCMRNVIESTSFYHTVIGSYLRSCDTTTTTTTTTIIPLMVAPGWRAGNGVDVVMIWGARNAIVPLDCDTIACVERIVELSFLRTRAS